MTSARTVRPTDLVALVAFDGRVYPNESVTRDRIGTRASPHPLETALEQWFSFATGRHTCISVKGATLRGLVSARRRGSNAAWEVDCLIDAADDDSTVLLGLLEKVVEDAGRAGAEKVFLRISATSDVFKTASSVRFTAYQREHLLTATGPLASIENDGESLRRWSKADAFPAFQLYNRWTPEAVRSVEATTFKEWQAARESAAPGRATQQRVIELDARIAGWLRTAASSDVGRFDLMAEPELLDTLIDSALLRLREQTTLLTLVPDFAVGLRERLEARGFVEREEFVVLARRTTVPEQVAEPELAAVASTA